MASKRVVLFLEGYPYLLSGYRESDTHIRGWVENGHWSLYVVKDDSPDFWHAYSGTARKSLDDICSSDLRRIDPSKVERIEVPENVLGDYNVIINWAQAKRKTNAKS